MDGYTTHTSKGVGMVTEPAPITNNTRRPWGPSTPTQLDGYAPVAHTSKEVGMVTEPALTQLAEMHKGVTRAKTWPACE